MNNTNNTRARQNHLFTQRFENQNMVQRYTIVKSTLYRTQNNKQVDIKVQPSYETSFKTKKPLMHNKEISKIANIYDAKRKISKTYKIILDADKLKYKNKASLPRHCPPAVKE